MRHFVENDCSSVAAPASMLSRSWGAVWAPAEAAGQSVSTKTRERILIVEDDLLIATQMEAALHEAGFDVIGLAASGEEALELAGSDSPLLVVVDIRLAGDRDGVDTALELFRSYGIRCIFATAHTDSEARQRAAPAAPLGWLQKPYAMTSLTAMVRGAVESLRGRRS